MEENDGPEDLVRQLWDLKVVYLINHVSKYEGTSNIIMIKFDG